jgi:hypothetical protein
MSISVAPPSRASGVASFTGSDAARREAVATAAISTGDPRSASAATAARSG